MDLQNPIKSEINKRENSVQKEVRNKDLNGWDEYNKDRNGSWTVDLTKVPEGWLPGDTPPELRKRREEHANYDEIPQSINYSLITLNPIII